MLYIYIRRLLLIRVFICFDFYFPVCLMSKKLRTAAKKLPDLAMTYKQEKRKKKKSLSHVKYVNHMHYLISIYDIELQSHARNVFGYLNE